MILSDHTIVIPSKIQKEDLEIEDLSQDRKEDLKTDQDPPSPSKPPKIA